MGKQGKQQRSEPTQKDIDQALQPQQPLAPQPAGMRAGQSLLGKAVRALIGGRMQTILLTDYDQSSDSYWGEAVRCNPGEGDEKVPIHTAVSGLRPYPYADRPDYSFQFVEPGADESVLINIAAGLVRSPE